MQTPVADVVRFVVAQYIRVPDETITRRSHLKRDLGLDPLDLVQIALRIEALEQTEFPIARLEDAHTLGDLNRIVQSMRTACLRAPPFTLDAMPVKAGATEHHPRRACRRTWRRRAEHT